MAIDSSCPENQNSTDCLLRSLLQLIDNQYTQDNAEFNWDPITFGFTAPVGIVAAVFALVTIFQAIAAAGRGRRKSNHRAIGGWQRSTTRKWSWDEMGFQYTTKTPVMTENAMLSTFYQKGSYAPALWEPPSAPPVATWVGLLHQLGIEDLSSDSPVEFKSVAADYLPDDLLAAPAYADVAFIVAALSTAGASWRTDAQSLYPVILGPTFQFDFRQHPSLGVVGAFSRYSYRYLSGWDRQPSAEELVAAILNSQGNIAVGSLLSLDSIRYVDIGSVGVEKHLNIFQRSIPDGTLSAIHTLKCTCKLKHLCKTAIFYNREDTHNLLWLFLTSTPSHPPTIFPSRHLQNENVLSGLALNSRFWSNTYTMRKFPSLENDAKPVLFGGSEVIWDKSDFPESIYQTIRKATVSNFRNETLVGFGIVLQSCFKLLQGTKSFLSEFRHFTQQKQQYFRQLVLLQLKEVDKWLKEIDEQSVRCRVVTLCCTTMSFLDVEQGCQSDSLGHPNLFADDDHCPFRPSWIKDCLYDCLPNDVLLKHFQALGYLLFFITYRKEKDIFHNKYPEYFGRVESREEKFLDHLAGIRRISAQNMSKPIGLLVQQLVTMLEVSFGDITFYQPFNHSVNLWTWVNHSSELFSDGDEDPNQAINENGVGENEAKDTNMEQNSQTNEEIDDMLIWRCILIAMLYWTALDNTDLLQSPIWEHIVPVL